MKDFSRWIRLDMNWDSTEWLFDLDPLPQLAWIKLLCYVKQAGIQGRVRAPALKVLAAQWKIPTTEIENMLAAGERNGSIQIDGNCWTITSWTDFQNPDSKRKQAWRTKNKPDVHGHSVDAYGPLSRDIDTDIDKDTDDDTESDEDEEIAEARGSRREARGSVQQLHSYTQQAFRRTPQAPSLKPQAKPQRTTPSLEHCLAFGDQIGFTPTESATFFHYYNARGWILGSGHPIVNWHSAMQLWLNRKTSDIEIKATKQNLQPEFAMLTNIRRLDDEELARLTA